MRIVDMHCDTIYELLIRKRQGKGYSLRVNDCQVDLERLKRSGYLLQNFALFIDMEKVPIMQKTDSVQKADSKEKADSVEKADSMEKVNVWEEAMEQFGLYEEEMRNNCDLIRVVCCYEDVAANEEKGCMSSLLTVEEGGVCRGNIEKLRSLYHMGVRMMTLTWNYPNELGYPNLNLLQERGVDFLYTPDVSNGLTGKGREFVAEMESLGMIIDVSHLSDAGFYDVLNNTTGPFVASHSNARAICPCVRNLTDDMIRKLAERGGVVGLNFCADFLTRQPAGEANPGTVQDIIAHARHMVHVGGEECLGMGSDFDGIDPHKELCGAEKMDLLWDAMEKGGFLPSQMDKIFYRNVLRLYRDVL